jgi:hypothetical protein
MKIATLSRLLLLTLILTSSSGCATHALWSSSGLDALNQPATDPHLALYYGKSKKDLLVVYDEFSERNESIHRRAYWLEENRRRTEERECPYFVSQRLARGLAGVPVFSAASATNRLPFDQPETLFAVVATNNVCFTLFSGSAEIDSHRLPVYDDGTGQTKRILLTPLTVTADAAIVGGFLGYLYLEGVAQGQDPGPLFH